ncbi:MAG: hypothetical protein FD123_1123 [Bacteroidetes bacterium]|nr:MAG: hypothetical protein FD123_1123 [Bacteroidota bacterium]
MLFGVPLRTGVRPDPDVNDVNGVVAPVVREDYEDDDEC